MQKVMIVEDDPVIREELTLLLKNEGYFPLAVTDFTTIKEQATKLKPDLILLDINLPGQDGFRSVPAFRCQAVRRLSLSQAGILLWMKSRR